MGRIIKLKGLAAMSKTAIKNAKTRAKKKYEKYCKCNPVVTYVDGKRV